MLEYTPEQYGAIGDGVTDDSVAMHDAADAARAAGYPLTIGPKTYRASIVWRRGYDFRGLGLTVSGSPASVIRGLPGKPTFTWEKTPTVYNSRMTDLRLLSDNAPIIFKDDSNQPDGLLVDRCNLTGNSSTGTGAPALRILGGFSGVTIRQSQIWGNPYGIDCEIPVGYGSALDWWTIEDVIIGGAKTALRWRTSNSGGGNWAWRRVRFGGGSESTMIIHGNAPGWIWERCAAAEAQGGGNWATGKTWVGAATAAAGQNVATIPQAGLAVGDQLTIKSGMVDADHYVGVIQAINGTQVTLNLPFARAVTSSPCTNATADIIKVPMDAEDPGFIGHPSGHIFLASGFGRGAGSNIRYSVGGGSHHQFIRFTTWRAPVYEKYRRSTIVDSPDLSIWSTIVRPGAAEFNVGFERWDEILKKPLWSDGSNWRDSAGTII